MTITWKQELNLLNDEQLGRIAFASKDSWGYYYYNIGGSGCCIYGHALELNAENVVERMRDVFNQLGIFVNNISSAESPLEKYYQTAFLPYYPYPKIEYHQEIIEEIQNEAKRILEERKQRVSEEPEIVTV